MYIKFDILAMFTSGENKYFLNCLHLGSYAVKHYTRNLKLVCLGLEEIQVSIQLLTWEIGASVSSC